MECRRKRSRRGLTGIIVSRATTSLAENAWFLACLVITLIAAAILLAVGVPELVALVRGRNGGPAAAKAEEQAGPRAVQLRDHFEPRARGILPTQIRGGSYFTGRVRVLGELSAWLAQPDAVDCRARVVTGGPGSGKSAVLGRLIALADPQLQDKWKASGTHAPAGTVPPPGVTIVAVHAHTRPVDEVAAQIAYALGVRETTAVGLLGALRNDWKPRPAAVAVMVDSVDEAADPRRLIAGLLRPLAEAAARTGIRLLVGTRPGGGDDLVGRFGSSAVILDLDSPEYLDRDDIQEYVRRTLLAEGDPQAATPYREQPALAAAVAHAIAVRATPSFLIAQLTALSLTKLTQPVDTAVPGWMEEFPDNVGDTMELYLADARPGGRWLRDLLTTLAWSQGYGLDKQLWAAAAAALETEEYSEHHVVQLLDSPTADLIHSTVRGDQTTYLLFHEALAEYLRQRSSTYRSPRETHRRLADALTAHLPRTSADAPDWSRAGEYTCMYLAYHAAQGQVLDPLLEEAGFLVMAEPARLLAALPAASTDRGRRIARVVQRVGQQLLQASPDEHVCYLEMSARMAADDHLAAELAAFAPQRTWSVPWAQWDTLDDGRLLGHHEEWVLAVSAIEISSGTVVVSASTWEIRAWHLTDGSPVLPAVPEPPSPIADMVAFNVADQVVVLTLHKDGELRRATLGASDPARILASGRAASEGIWLIWDAGRLGVVTVSQSHVVEVLSPEDGQLADFKPISAAGRGVLTAGTANGRCLLVMATGGGREEPTTDMVTLDMATGIPLGPPLRPAEHFPDRKWPITIGSADITERDGKPAVLVGAYPSPAAMWDPVRGDLIDEPRHEGAAVFSVLSVRTADGDFQCWGDADGNLFLRSAGASEPRRLVAHDSGIEAMTACRLDGDTVIVTGGRDGAVRVWKPGDAKPAHLSRYCYGLVIMPSADHGQPLIASINAAGSGQVLAAANGQALAELRAPEGAELRCIAVLPGYAAAVVTVDSQSQVAVWRPPGSHPVQTWHLPCDSIPRTIAVAGGNRPVLLAAMQDGRLAFLDLMTGQETRPPLKCHHGAFAVMADPGPQPDDVLRFITAMRQAPYETRLWTMGVGGATSHELVTAPEPDHGDPVWVWAAVFGQVHHRHVIVGAGTSSWLYMWDAANGEALMRKQLEHAHQMELLDVDIAEMAGGNVILSGGYTCSLVLWPLDKSEEHHLWVGSPLHFIKSLPNDRAVVAGPRGIIAFQLTQRLPGKHNDELTVTAPAH